MLKLFANRGKGSVTVFVTLIMIPTVFFTAFLGDLARTKLYGNLALMTADNYGESILTEYNDLLRELYGFFSVTQDTDALQAIETLEGYSKGAFNPNTNTISYQYLKSIRGTTKYDGFAPYKGADVSLSYKPIENANLNNKETFATQLGDFMRFRIAQQLLMSGDVSEDGEIGGQLTDMEKQVSEHEGDMEAIDAQQKFSEVLQEYMDLLGEYYEYLYLVEEEYDAYQGSYGIYHNGTIDEYNELLRSDEYKEYQMIKDPENQEKLSAAKAKKEKGDNLTAEEEELYNANEHFEDNKKKIEYFMDSMGEYANSNRDKYFDYSITKDFGIKDSNWTNRGHKLKDDHHINMNNYNSYLEKLKKLSGQISGKADNVIDAKNKWVTALNAKDENGNPKVSENIREAESIKTCIARVDEITNKETVQLFSEIYNYINDNNKSENEDLKKKYGYEKKAFEEVDKLIKNGDIKPYYEIDVTKIKEYDDQVNQVLDVSCSIKLIRSVAKYNAFYKKLSEGCDFDIDVNGKKDEAEKEKQKGADMTKQGDDGVKEMEEQEKKDAAKVRSIPDSYNFGGNNGGDDSDLKQMMSKVGNLLSNGGWGNAGNEALLKLYAIEYDFGMFSSRVTQVRKDKEKENEEDKNYGEEILDNATGTSTISLTGYEKCKSINYMYGAELEYVIHGSKSAKSNLNYTRNLICGFRMIMNFASSYSIGPINGAIEAISEPLNAVPFIGPALAIAVNIALRLGFAAIETYAEWQALMRGEKVVLYKNDPEQLDSLDLLRNWFPNAGLPEITNKQGFGFTYEQYLLIMMIFLTSSDHIFARTENLIELNMNAVIEGVGEDGNLEDNYDAAAFKMKNAYTAVEATCSVHMDFVLIPDGFAKLFLGAKTDGGAGDTAYEDLKNLEKTVYEYKVIRGY